MKILNKKVLVASLLIISTIVAAFAMLNLDVTGQASDTTVYIDPPEITVMPCTTFTVDVNIADVEDLWQFDIFVHYLPEIVTAMSVSEGPFLPDGPPIRATLFTWDIGPDFAHFMGILIPPEVPPGVSGSGTLATVEFHCLAEGNSSLVIESVLIDSQGAMINHTTVDGCAIQKYPWEPIKLQHIVEWPYPYYLVDLPFVPPSSPEGYAEVKAELEAKGYVFDNTDGTASEVTMFIEEEEVSGTVTSWWSSNTLEDGTRACMLSYETEDPGDPGMAMGFVTNLLPPEQVPDVDPYIIVNAMPYFFVRWYWWSWYPVGKVVSWSYWWYDSHHHKNWFWGPYWWWRIHIKSYYYPYIDIPYWRPWWGWWWHWMYWRHWHWWSTFFPYDP